MVGTVSRLVATRLESQEVQVWQAEKAIFLTNILTVKTLY